MYCGRCGAANAEDALFCKSCGAPLKPAARPPAALPASAPTHGVAWWVPLGILGILATAFLVIDLVLGGGFFFFATGTLATAVIVGIILMAGAIGPTHRRPAALALGIALIVAPVAFVPFLLNPPLPPWQGVGAQRTFTLPSEPGVDRLDLSVDNTVGSIHVSSVDTSAFLATARVNISGRGNQAQALTGIQWTNETFGPRAVVHLAMPRTSHFLGFGLGYEVDVRVSRSALLNLSVTSSTGAIDVNLGPGTPLGTVSLQTTTGVVDLLADAPVLSGGSRLTLRTTTGSVGARILSPSGSPGTVPVHASTTTGSVMVTLDLGPTVAARGTARTTTGSVHVDLMKYQGTAASFQTPNIGSAMEVLDLTLETTTGSVDVG